MVGVLLVCGTGAITAASVSAKAASCPSVAGADACLGLTSAPFVSPAQAKLVIKALWAAREKAKVDRDAKLLMRLDGGSAALTDVAVVTSLRCGCGSFYRAAAPTRFIGAVTYLPRQDRYPLYFAADLTETAAGSPPVQSLMVVTRASSEQPWRITFQFYGLGATSASEFGPPEVDRAGYDLTPTGPYGAAVHAWFADYVAYLNGLKQAGHRPLASGFAPPPGGSHLDAHPNGSTSDGVTHTYTFEAGPFGGPWVLATDRGPIICGDVAEYSVARPSQRGKVLVYQTPTRGRVDWDWELPPGSYSSTTTLLEWPLCLYSTPGKFVIDGPWTGGYPIRETGTKARRDSTNAIAATSR